jgi:hypothetical protein
MCGVYLHSPNMSSWLGAQLRKKKLLLISSDMDVGHCKLVIPYPSPASIPVPSWVSIQSRKLPKNSQKN